MSFSGSDKKSAGKNRTLRHALTWVAVGTVSALASYSGAAPHKSMSRMSSVAGSKGEPDSMTVDLFAGSQMASIRSEVRAEDFKNSIPNAIGVYVTQRGQKVFADDLQRILRLNGKDFSELQFKGISWEAPAPILNDGLPLKVQREQSSFFAVRDSLKRWLMNLDFNDPRPKVDIGTINTKARFTRFSIRTDLAAQKAAGLANGVGLVLEAEAPEVQVSVSSVRATDLANDYLGQFGLNNLEIRVAKGSVPLKVLLPILVQANPKDGLSIQALRLRTNLQELNTQLSFARPLVVPTVEIRVNGHVMGQLNPKAIEDEILKQQAGLSRALLALAKEYVEKQLPNKINADLAALAAQGLDDINELNPPGAGDQVPPSDRFRWGVGVEETTLTKSHLYVGLRGFVRDPKKAKQSPIPDAPDVLLMLKDIDPNSYDLALALNQIFVNRMLQLSYERGYFDKIPLNENATDFIALAAPPELHADGINQHDRAKLRLRVRHTVSGISAIAVRSPIEVTFDVNVRLTRNSNGDAAMIIDGIDVNGAEVEDRFIRLSMFRDNVMAKVHETLAAKSAGYQAKPRPLMKRIPVPSEVFGIPIKLKDIRTESSGHLLLFMEYGAIPGV